MSNEYGSENLDNITEIGVSSVQTKPVKISKSAFKFKKDGNGVILTIHHTIKRNGKMVRIRLVEGCFNYSCTHLIAIDTRANIFVFNLSTKKFWKLPELIPKACFVRNIPHKQHEYIVGTKNGFIALLDVEQAQILKFTQYTGERIWNISFPGVVLTPILALVQCGNDTVLLNVETFESSHRLDFNSKKISLKYATYIPGSDTIFTCFTDDSVHIWSGITLNTIRVINPIRKRDRILTYGPVSKLIEVRLCSEDEEITGYRENDFQINDSSAGLIKSFAFSPDGTVICLATIDNYLILLNGITFDVFRLVRIRHCSIKECAFLRRSQDLLLIGLTTEGMLVLIDCHNNDMKIIIEQNGVKRFSLSLDGKLICAITEIGEANVWLTCKFFNMLKSAESCLDVFKAALNEKKKTNGSEMTLCMNENIRSLISPQRIKPILREYGSYPDKYRDCIWGSLLKLPYNRQQFYELVQMGMHANIEMIGRKIQIKNATLKQYFLKILSCLAHWSKVFAFSDFLPHFVFPFVKTFSRNSLYTFETIATILMNQCQLWFEFHPMEPMNYLGIIENILNYFDTDLMQFYLTRNITPKQYAWSMLINGFSVVLVEHQWLGLWDNIITYPSYFLVFIVVAYNILKREDIMRLHDTNTIERYFQEQNALILRHLILKAHNLMERCPEELHPLRYMQEFTELPARVYPKFTNYPQKCVDQQDDEMKTLKEENEKIEQRIRQLEAEEMNIIKSLEDRLQAEEQSKRLNEMEKVYRDTLNREEARLRLQRKTLLLYQKEIRNQRGKVINLMKESGDRRSINLQETELDNLANDVEKERNRNEIDMTFAEDQLREHQLQNVVQKFIGNAAATNEREMRYQPMANKYQKEIIQMYNARAELKNDLSKLSNIEEIDEDEEATDKQSRSNREADKKLPPHNVNMKTAGNGKSFIGSYVYLDDIEGELNEIQKEFVSLVYH